MAAGAAAKGNGKFMKGLGLDFIGSAMPSALLSYSASHRRETPGRFRRATEAFEGRSPGG